MKSESIGLVRGSGNVFRDLGHASPDVEQLKAILAAEIIKMLDREELTVRAAHARTGIAAADFSRIRNADLSRFTLNRLVSIINRLGSRVEVQVNVRMLEPCDEALAGNLGVAIWLLWVGFGGGAPPLAHLFDRKRSGMGGTRHSQPITG
jgi:predicted XRE-type DNA-binding protein